jgi:hypothetical protein
MPDDTSTLGSMVEGWRKLAFQMQPSQGPFSGGFKPGGTANNDAQWLRKISLIVYSGKDGDKQNGIELAQLRITFNVHKKVTQHPNLLEAKVYNLSDATMQKVAQFKRVQLTAGYVFANYAVIFDGTVVQYRRGRENPTDTYFEILAGDGDAQINQSTTIYRFEAGTKEKDVISHLAKDTGLDAGHISTKVGMDTLTRAWTLAGPTSQYLREMVMKYGANYWAENGKLNIVHSTEVLPGEVVVLDPTTGLVQIPEDTPEGIQVKCLINPVIKLGGLIKLDKKFISGIAYYPGSGEEMSGSAGQAQAFGPGAARSGAPVDVPEPTSPIGLYKVMTMEIFGDTRGKPWYMDLVCLAATADGQVAPGIGTQSVMLRSGPVPGAGWKGQN